MPLAVVDSPLTIAALIAVVVALLLVDLVFFARGREPTFRESVVWSLGWLLLGLAMALPMWAIDNGDGAITAAEHEAGYKKMFEKMDKDHNGKLSAAEVQAGHDRMMTAEDQ